ncbi:FmdB family zinc ribbon protein [Mycolicibacterium sp. 624]|uniref:FmdB family zinc ribbon protein n=1 Tax=Mycolicibacterium sp. 624 TaxID=3156314 RepID=UPI0033936119
MPTYSYACTECDNRFDAVQAFTDDALTSCEKCTGRLRKLYGSVGVVFKGSGFYRNDSRDSSKTTASSSSNGSKSGDSSSSTSSSSDSSSSSSTSGSSSSNSGSSGSGSGSSSSSSSSNSAPAAASS